VSENVRLAFVAESPFDVRVGGVFAPKAEGEHRWAAVVTFPVSAADAIVLREGNAVTVAAGEHVLTVLACVDCQLPYDQAAAVPCEAPPFGDPRA
jgi:hypothetical protein